MGYTSKNTGMVTQGYSLEPRTPNKIKIIPQLLICSLEKLTLLVMRKNTQERYQKDIRKVFKIFASSQDRTIQLASIQ